VKQVTIDPVTRIEGHGKVEIFVDDSGDVSSAYFVVPELRGFEQLCVGRPVEEMPSLTSRVCGLCPEAHHMASAKALDTLFGVEPPPAVRAIRELLYMAFIVSNHATHFFALAGPDFLIGDEAEDDQRNLFGVLREMGPDFARRVLASRSNNHEVIELLGGRRIHPVAALPGGWSRHVTEQMRERILEVAEENVAFAQDCLRLYQEQVVSRPDHLELVVSEAFTQPTYSMGTVDESGRLSFYDGTLRVVDPDGSEVVSFPAADYRSHIAEHIEPWTYVKLPYLRSLGWNGLAVESGSGVFAVGPLPRLNTADGLSTRLAQRAFVEMYETLGGWRHGSRHRAIHHRLAGNWARLVEQLHAAERMLELAMLQELTDRNVRAAVPENPVVTEAVGCVEAPRGTLLHRYTTDSAGIVTSVDLIVATTNNHAAIALGVTAAARSLISPHSEATDEILNRIEMAIRAHDPCLACATHTFPGDMPLEVAVRDPSGQKTAFIRR
jgi:F420-non-reducing hydrogenase large subunit